jgi:hypothetical protein
MHYTIHRVMVECLGSRVEDPEGATMNVIEGLSSCLYRPIVPKLGHMHCTIPRATDVCPDSPAAGHTGAPKSGTEE